MEVEVVLMKVEAVEVAVLQEVEVLVMSTPHPQPHNIHPVAY